MIPEWCAKYVGTPFLEHGRTRSGCDCWGLVRLALYEHFAIGVRDFSDCYCGIEDAETIQALCRMEAEAWQRVEDPRPGDVVLMRIAGIARHVGLVVAPGLMLHTEAGMSAVCEPYTGPVWKNRIEGFYRHVD